ncbi:hypothetical protein [Streptomyces sp. enrichment culture]|uniref:hypothetical protein n=1 Tax=Streptomyces sp. enrichment culture TaxID=1795815 RepID=UPI003F56F30A
METKTVDQEPGADEAETRAEAPAGAAEAPEAVEAVEQAGTEADAGAEAEAEATDAAGAPEDADTTEEPGPSGVGQGAGAVVSAALGFVSLTGGWIGTVASARESLIGQLETSSSSSVATMVKEGYGDAWQASALWAGLFALTALVVGVAVLARPAFGAPGRPQAPWIKSVSWAGVSLGLIGLLLAVLKYTDVLLGLPSA